jgi:hypothetical protein
MKHNCLLLMVLLLSLGLVGCYTAVTYAPPRAAPPIHGSTCADCHSDRAHDYYYGYRDPYYYSSPFSFSLGWSSYWPWWGSWGWSPWSYCGWGCGYPCYYCYDPCYRWDCGSRGCTLPGGRTQYWGDRTRPTVKPRSSPRTADARYRGSHPSRTRTVRYTRTTPRGHSRSGSSARYRSGSYQRSSSPRGSYGSRRTDGRSRSGGGSGAASRRR